MSNFVFPKAKEQFLQGTNLSSGNIVIVLTSDGWVPTTAMDTLDEAPSGSVVATSGNLTSKTFTNGTFDAADVTYTSLTGETVTGYLCVLSTGTPSTSLLLSWTDTNQDTTPISVAPDGTNFTLRFSTSGIFTI